MGKRVGRAVGTWILKGIILAVRLLPFNASLAFGRALGDFVRAVSKKRYRIALENLQIAYGDELSEEERRRIARESFQSFGMFMIESIKFGFLSKEDVENRVSACPECREYADRFLREGKGCLFISGHLGNFEVVGRLYTSLEYELYALSRAARDTGTTRIMEEIRDRMGIKVIHINRSLRPVMEALKRNSAVAIICDQNAADVYVPFFGHPTGTVDGPAKFALKTGAPMLFFMGVRDPGGKYHVECTGFYKPAPTGDTQADIERVMTEVNRQIEQMIRKYPGQWLWFHDRWKSSPGVKESALRH